MEDVLEVYSRPRDPQRPLVCMDEQPIELHHDSREHRCRKDWAQEIKQLVDEDFPDAEKIILVCDNLNTHDIASLYEAFEPSEARRIWTRIELHHTPKHGSWLDMAEIELSAFTKECLGRRIGDINALKAEATAWYRDRNHRQKGIDWQVPKRSGVPHRWKAAEPRFAARVPRQKTDLRRKGGGPAPGSLISYNRLGLPA